MLTIKSATLLSLSIFCCLEAVRTVDQYGFSVDGMTSTERINSALRCMNINPQNSVDLEQIMGLWYGSEIILHSQDYPDVYKYDSCVIIHLADVTEQVRNGFINNNGYNNRGYGPDYNNRQQNNYRRTQYGQTTTPQYLDNDDYLRQLSDADRMRYLRLVWSERENNLEYTFNYTTNAPGHWSNVGDQRGTLVLLNSYTQFTGTVQVVKAVSDHLVLTFCGNDVKTSIYTVVLTRNRLGLSADELRSIRNLLSRRGLYTENIRKVCNGAGHLKGAFFLSLLSLFSLYIWWRK
ncbi:uncharacterized protein LOC115628345 [Scaptodrosophila lebanonensis]|uniref:Uncharacterized protein LOC115628345 n=1 Tax=Drosophila lebanonensis TaxID=7225 RepID=A0A6J2TUN6_DROLE|nr:uncharacterized protein LOC115628345 [Scaptodrosophila lebanonensis]